MVQLTDSNLATKTKLMYGFSRHCVVWSLRLLGYCRVTEFNSLSILNSALFTWHLNVSLEKHNFSFSEKWNRCKFNWQRLTFHRYRCTRCGASLPWCSSNAGRGCKEKKKNRSSEEKPPVRKRKLNHFSTAEITENSNSLKDFHCPLPDSMHF